MSRFSRLIFNPDATSFFLSSGNPGMLLKSKKRKHVIANLRPEDIDKHIQNLPQGSYEYAIIAEHSQTADGVEVIDYYFKLGKGNHAIIALSHEQIQQINDQETFNKIMETVIVLAAGELYKKPKGCYLTDQSGGFHRNSFTFETYIEHQNLLHTMHLSRYPFHYFTTSQQCKKTISMLNHTQLTQLTAQKNRIAIFKIYDRLLRSRSTELGISVPESINNEYILHLAQKKLADTHTIRPRSAPLLPSQTHRPSDAPLSKRRPKSSLLRRSLSFPISPEEKGLPTTAHTKHCRQSSPRLSFWRPKKITRVVPTNMNGSLICDLRLSPRENSRYDTQSCDDVSVVCLKYGTNNNCI